MQECFRMFSVLFKMLEGDTTGCGDTHLNVISRLPTKRFYLIYLIVIPVYSY